MEEECTPYARDCVTKGRQEPDGDGACFYPSTREAEAKQISVSLSWGQPGLQELVPVSGTKTTEKPCLIKQNKKQQQQKEEREGASALPPFEA